MTKLFKALADFQQEVPVIFKGTQGYGYAYADLPAIFEIINPLMKKNGLGFYQAMNEKQIKTVVFHIESGEQIESNTDIPQGVTLKGMNDFQVLGSATTYIRRYALSSLLGLVTDKDTDGSGQVNHQVNNSDERVNEIMPEITHDNSDVPICSACGNFKKFIPAGVSKATGKPYNGFWACPNKCRE